MCCPLPSFESVSATASSSVPENNLPFCWSYHNDGAIDYSAYPLVIIGNEAHGGSRSLMFYSHYNADLFSDQYAVMPATDSTLFPINHLKLSFWMRTISRVYNSYCVVGVMRDPTDTSSFVAVDTVYSNRSTSYVRNTVPLSSYNGPHGRVAFKFPRPNGGYNHGYVDDILLEDMPPCPYVSSHNVVASPSAATMSWTYEHGYQEDPESYEVSYSYAADSLHGATSVTVSSPSLTLTGLDPDTSYMVSIRYVCDNPSNPPYIFFFSTRAAPDSCMAPTLFVEENESGNIVASWLPGYRETSWNLDCRAVDSSAWSSILVGTTSNSFTFSSEDLRPNTLYYFRVTANCGDHCTVHNSLPAACTAIHIRI